MGHKVKITRNSRYAPIRYEATAGAVDCAALCSDDSGLQAGGNKKAAIRPPAITATPR